LGRPNREATGFILSYDSDISNGILSYDSDISNGFEGTARKLWGKVWKFGAICLQHNRIQNSNDQQIQCLTVEKWLGTGVPIPALHAAPRHTPKEASFVSGRMHKEFLINLAAAGDM